MTLTGLYIHYLNFDHAIHPERSQDLTQVETPKLSGYIQDGCLDHSLDGHAKLYQVRHQQCEYKTFLKRMNIYLVHHSSGTMKIERTYRSVINSFKFRNEICFVWEFLTGTSLCDSVKCSAGSSDVEFLNISMRTNFC